MNSSKMLFLSITVLGTLTALSSTSWIGMWMGMEINLMAFISLISDKKNKNNSQGMMIYFLVQSVSSILFLFSILLSLKITDTFSTFKFMNIMIMASLMMKLGVPPFHMWFPELMSKLNWVKCLILLTWQKLAPLTVMSNLIFNNNFINIIIVITAFTGAIGGLNQVSLRKLMAYSSINHMAWMLMFMSISNLWYYYFMIYMISMLMLGFIMNKLNVYFINQFHIMNLSFMKKITIASLLLSIGGLPPFLGFLPKLITIQSMINSSLFFMIFMLFMSSLLTLFYYTRMITPLILNYSTLTKWSNNKNLDNYMIMILLINLALPFMTIISFF
uniref:NADH dehydrogenase subunit 2 n=1 Tax=Paramarcius puncticeps TaxID=2924071 RepID=UPI001FA6B515|nr:NADH dehydrogenase subunit 2 [Paramarcius puncticeps]UMY75883.1 NADH dehydrogenase subunit 2 [Paramarcius puncticeps]